MPLSGKNLIIKKDVHEFNILGTPELDPMCDEYL